MHPRFFLLVAVLVVATVLPASAIMPVTPTKDVTTLEHATLFAIGGIGIAGKTSSEEEAFRAVLKQAGSAAQFQRLLGTASPEGQMYALLGLRLLDKKAFDAALPRFLDRTDAVLTFSGCLGGKWAVQDLAKSIQAGQYQ